MDEKCREEYTGQNRSVEDQKKISNLGDRRQLRPKSVFTSETGSSICTSVLKENSNIDLAGTERM